MSVRAHHAPYELPEIPRFAVTGCWSRVDSNCRYRLFGVKMADSFWFLFLWKKPAELRASWGCGDVASLS